MTPLVASALASLAALGAADPDRSGLPLLQSVLNAASKSTFVHVRIVREQREEESGVYTADSVTEFWWDSGGKFRFDRTGMWGDGLLVVNDGASMWVDTLDEGLAPEKQPGMKRFENPGSAAELLGDRSPLIALYAGPDVSLALGESGTVVEEPREGLFRRLRVRADTIGDVIFVLDVRERVVEMRMQTNGGTTSREYVRYLQGPREGVFKFTDPRRVSKGP